MPRYSLLLLLGLLKATLSPLAAASEDKGVLDPLQGSAGSSALPRLTLLWHHGSAPHGAIPAGQPQPGIFMG